MLLASDGIFLHTNLDRPMDFEIFVLVRKIAVVLYLFHVWTKVI